MPKNRVFRQIFKFRGLADSFRLAAQGVIYLFLYHRNMRIIFLLGIAALAFGLYLGLSATELVALCLTVTLVFIAEIFNSAIEMIIDMITVKYRTRVKLLKDIAAAVVLLASLNALAVGYILFVKKLF